MTEFQERDSDLGNGMKYPSEVLVSLHSLQREF